MIFFFHILVPNPCEPNPCYHNSQCVLLPGFGKNHECNCTIGWSGNTCQSESLSFSPFRNLSFQQLTIYTSVDCASTNDTF